MANNPITTPLPADLPTNWTYGQTIGASGIDVGLTEQHGYNYLMKQVNAAQQAATQIGQSFSGIPSLGSDGKIPSSQLPAMNYDPAGSAAAVQKNLDDHTGNKNNPHAVTAAQVGAAIELSEGSGITTLDELLAKRPSGFYGVSPPSTGFPRSDYWNVIVWADKRVPSGGNYTRAIYASPVNSNELWKLQITNGGNKGWVRLTTAEELSSHVNNKSNPHGVTAQQVGADPAGTAAAVQQALSSQIATLTAQMGGKVSFQTGTYKGTSSYRHTLTLPVSPKVLIIMAQYKEDEEITPLVAIGPGYYLISSSSMSGSVPAICEVSEFGSSVEIYCGKTYRQAFNQSGVTYTWVALY